MESLKFTLVKGASPLGTRTQRVIKVHLATVGSTMDSLDLDWQREVASNGLKRSVTSQFQSTDKI